MDTEDTIPDQTTSSNDAAASDLPFNFPDVEASFNQPPPGAGPLPPFHTATAPNPDKDCKKQCSEDQKSRNQVCSAMRKRVQLWLKEHGCPAVVSAPKKRASKKKTCKTTPKKRRTTSKKKTAKSSSCKCI